MIAQNDERIRKYLTQWRCPYPMIHGTDRENAFDRKSVDIPFVFRHNDRYYMLYTGFDGIGYQSALAVSDDLLHWKHEGVILKRNLSSSRWDRIGGAATWIIKESDSIWEVPRLRKVDGKYWMAYHSYPNNGYETGPAEIGLAWTEDESLMDWHFPDQPVFSWKDGESWEAGGLYKACVVENQGVWYMFYNAKNEGEPWIEQTGVAWSKDLKNWMRAEENPILPVTSGKWDETFVSDPYIVRDGDLWLNFYYGLGVMNPDGNYHAQEGLALSQDLFHWDKVDGPILPYGSPGSIDSGHVHKASIFYENGVLYHFYCATRPWNKGDPTTLFNEFRTICVAASKPVF